MHNSNGSRTYPLSVGIASFLVACFIDVKCINYIMKAITGKDEGGFMSIIYVVLAISLIFTGLVLQKNNIFRKNFYVLFLSILIISFYFYTSFSIASPRVPFLYLSVFTIMALITPSLVQIDIKATLKYIMILPVLGVFFTNSIFVSSNEDLNTISMMVSYAFLVPVLANIVYYRRYYKEDALDARLFFWIASLVNVIYLYQLISRGSRGPFLCILSLLFFMWVVKKDKMNKIKVSKGKLPLLIIGSFLLFIFGTGFITGLSDIFHYYGLDLNVIDKFGRKLAETGDMSNGRDLIYNVAINGISERPLWGHGMDQFENNTGFVYPHNFILQTLYDGGLIFFVLLIIPVLYAFVKKISKSNNDEYIWLLFLFFYSVPGALLSSDMWNVERLWIFFGAVFSSVFIYKNSKLKKFN